MRMMSDPKRRSQSITPRAGWYWFAVLLFLVTAILAPALILLPLFRNHVATTFIVPGTNQVRLRAGDYVLWDDYKTILNGTTYSLSSNPPSSLTVKMSRVVDTFEVSQTSVGNVW